MIWAQLGEAVQNNLDNSDFSAEDFAKAMYMSRIQLNRKLEALTNLSTNIYLRTEGLQAAKKMMQNSDAIVANVAYYVGFGSPSFLVNALRSKLG